MGGRQLRRRFGLPVDVVGGRMGLVGGVRGSDRGTYRWAGGIRGRNRMGHSRGGLDIIAASGWVGINRRWLGTRWDILGFRMNVVYMHHYTKGLKHHFHSINFVKQ